jgi:SAM-dependent methyltransferase
MKKLFFNNVSVNGVKAMIYPFGLSASRYIEYAVALDFSSDLGLGMLILEAGCGHSILPIIRGRSHIETIVIDVSKEALKWQMREALKHKVKLHSVLASAEHLPFRDNIFSGASLISVLEHLSRDFEAAREVGRVLKPNGIGIVSVPLSSHEKSVTKSSYAVGIPTIWKRLFGSSLTIVFKLFRVDRGLSYFERHYTISDVHKRIIIPSGCKLESAVTLKSKRIVKTIHERIISTGVLTILEYILARWFMFTSNSTKNMDAIIFKLRKTSKQG